VQQKRFPEKGLEKRRISVHTTDTVTADRDLSLALELHEIAMEAVIPY